MVAGCAVRAGVLVGLCAVVRGQVGILADQIPFAADQDVEMEVNGDWQSGVAEEYVSGRLTVRVRSLAGLRYEIISKPQYGKIGWNNSVSGEFVYSPREYSAETTNHGREAVDQDDNPAPIPGCEDKCTGGETGDCPNKDPTKGPVATAEQILRVEDEEIGFPCVTHMAPVDYDQFKFRAVNDYGSSNWGTVTIKFERNDKPSGMLQFIFLVAGAMMAATCCGMGRVICLQAILNPNHKWRLCGSICGGFCAPPEEKGEGGHSADDVRHDMYGSDEDETQNPLNKAEDDAAE